MAAGALDVQRCTMCCSCCPACSSSFELSEMAGQSLRGLPKITMRKRHGKNQLLTRSLYSLLIESFGSTQLTFSDLNSSFSKLHNFRTSPSQQQEKSGAAASALQGKKSHDPVAAADIGHDNVHMKRSARTRPPSMSLSQGFSPHGKRSVYHTVGAVGHPLNTVKLPGPMGFVMAFAVAALGLKTAVAKQGFLTGTPQKICEKCEGYGVQQCHVCQGRGLLTWEGKLQHTDPCPLCFGSCLKKCSNCGGVKMKKGMPPSMASKFQLKAGLNRN